MTTNNRSAGLTHVELLVAIGLIGILVGLLIPAIQSVRESARRMKCLVNLRDVAIAAANFDAQFGYLPSGGWGLDWYAIRDRGSGLRQPGGFFYNILPFLDAQAIAGLAPSSSQMSLPIQSEFDAFLMSELPILRCPTKLDRPSNRTWWPAHPKSIVVRQPGTLDYCANAGSDTTWVGFKGPMSLVDGDSPLFLWPAATSFNGVVAIRQAVHSSEITDGSSSTLLAGEKFGRRLRIEDTGDDQTPWQGFSGDNVRWTFEVPARDDSPFGNPLMFGSSHVGLPIVLCDSGTKTLGFAIAEDVFQKLGVRADGGVVDF